MANEIKAKFGTPTALTITLASLASSTAGVGRQSTMVDNSSARAQRLHILGKITTGTSPTANKTIGIYFLRSDATRRTDGAGSSDAGLTVVTADLVYAVVTSSTSDVAYQFGFTVESPGPEWGIAVVHDTAVNLNSTGGNHAIYYTTENPEVQ